MKFKSVNYATGVLLIQGLYTYIFIKRVWVKNSLSKERKLEPISRVDLNHACAICHSFPSKSKWSLWILIKITYKRLHS